MCATEKLLTVLNWMGRCMLVHTNNCFLLSFLIIKSEDKSYFLGFNHLGLLILFSDLTWAMIVSH